MRNYLLIGGSRGIGAATSKLIHQNGDRYSILSRTVPSFQEGMKRHFQLDVIKDSLEGLEVGKTLDGLVYFPGTINLKPFRSLKEEDFIEDFQVNLLGAVKALKAFFPLLRKGNQPSVVLYSTVAVGQGMPFHASVAAAKGAVEGLMRSLAAEWAPTIRVNAIAPSLTGTSLAEKLLDSDQKRENADKRHPLRKIGQPEDIAEITAFLLSDKSSWITGQLIGVDGGLSTLKV
ncbi:MAG: SDR family oxidoreductase [Saprospirales bacterium]|nr:MAG: SDR family oxidoreductase [Saprospirales bacterium]